MKAYKCLFVDWHLTLSNSVFWEHLSNPTYPHYPIFDYMQAALFQSSAPGRWLLPWLRGALTSEEVIANVCQGTAFDQALVLAELIVSCQQMRLASEAIPALLSRLRAKGLKVVIATDNMDTFQRWTVPSLRLYELVDDILSSFELQALKMDTDEHGQSRFFADYLHSHAVGWGESLLLDDGGDEYGNVIRQFGIDYQHIEPGRGLVPALELMLDALE